MAQGIVRMKDVAERSGVSLTTVSRLLRNENTERFSKDTRQRVLRAAEDLGWSPNRLVQSIQSGKTWTVGMVMLPFDEHWQRITMMLHATLLEREHLPLALYPNYTNPQSEQDHLRHLMERRVDGLIVWPMRDEGSREYLLKTCVEQVPVVTIDSSLGADAPVTEVHTLEADGVGKAIDHLHGLGHRRIGYVGKAIQQDWAVERRESFLRRLNELDLEPVFVSQIDKFAADPFAQLRPRLTQATAVVAASEQLALALWQVCQAMGLRVPEDLSIVGFGRIYSEFGVWPKFTMIDQQPEEIARAAARAVLAGSTGNAGRAHRIEITPQLNVGKTTATPRP